MTADDANVRLVDHTWEARPELHTLYRFWVAARAAGEPVDQELDGWWSGRNWHALYDIGIWDPEFVVRFEPLADAEREAATIAGLRDDVERWYKGWKDAKREAADEARRAEAAEERLRRVRELVDSLRTSSEQCLDRRDAIAPFGSIHSEKRRSAWEEAARAFRSSADAVEAALDAEPIQSIGDTCCGKCPGDTCYVDGVTGA